MLGGVAASALAALLVFLLLWTATLAVLPFHQEQHSGAAAAGHHVCAVCLYAHGQIIAHDVSSAPALRQDCSEFEVPLTEALLPLAPDNRLPQGRAPPVAHA